MLLYLYYNADIPTIPKSRFEGTAGYADDIWVIAIAATFDETDEILRDMFCRDQGLLEWAQQHNSTWEMSKSHCIRFTRRRSEVRKDFSINGTSIKCTKSAKLLGVIIDEELRWKEHAEYAVRKAPSSPSQCRDSHAHPSACPTNMFVGSL
jgi:hypothetical protein